MANLTGTIGDDTFSGTSGNDQIDLSQGGEDSVYGGGGADVFIMGATFDGGDRLSVDAEASFNCVVRLGGDYSGGLTITGDMMSGFARIELAAGGTYDLTLADSLASRNAQMEILIGGATRLDASAMTESGLRANISTGAACEIIGTENPDYITVSAALNRADRFDGGADIDESHNIFNWNFSGTFHTAARTFANFGQIVGGSGQSISLFLNDGNVAAGTEVSFAAQGAALFDIDGHKEKDGQLQLGGGTGGDLLIAGHQRDILRGWDGDDTLVGGVGADSLTGGGGEDVFKFVTLRDSWIHSLDFIADLTNLDTIDVSGVDADKHTVGDQVFHLVTAFTGQAGEMTVSYDAAQNQTSVFGDVNGNGQADMVIHIYGDHHDFSNFVL